MKESRDILKNTLWEVAEILGFSKVTKPNRDQLIARLRERVGSVKSPVASTSKQSTSPPAKKTAPKPSPPPARPPPKRPAPPPTPKPRAVVNFDLTQSRFGAVLGSSTWSKLTTRFPAHIKLVPGTYFLGDKNVAYRIIGYLSTRPSFSVVVCAAWMLEDSSHVFKPSDVKTYRTDWLVTRFGGVEAKSLVEEKRVRDNASRYGIYPQAISSAGIVIDVGNTMRSVRVVDVNVHKHNTPIVVQEIVPTGPGASAKRWCINTARLNEARPNTISFAAAVPATSPPKAESSSTATPALGHTTKDDDDDHDPFSMDYDDDEDVVAKKPKIS